MTDSEQRIKELEAEITAFGDAATDVFEQMLNGHWKDDHDHDVINNAAMLRLKEAVRTTLNRRGLEGVIYDRT